MKTSVSNLNGSRNRRNLTSWWRSRDLRFSRKKSIENKESMMLERRVLKSLSIKFKRELSSEWRSKSSEIRRDSNFWRTSIEWRRKMLTKQSKRDRESISWWSRLLKPTLNHWSRKKKELKKKKIPKMKSSLIKNLETRRSMKLNSKLKELRMRKREKSKD